MSILIKGMDMPKPLNEDCVVVIRANGRADVWMSATKEFTTEAIEIPTPHGRLLDESELIEKWYKINDIDETDRGARFVGYTEITRMINDASTILEPEE